MASPYPWHYTLRWPFYYCWPSTKNHSHITTTPIAHNFINNNKVNYKRLLFCGDIMITQRDVVPTLHPAICDLLDKADLFIGNCEAPIGKQALNDHARYRMSFYMPQDFLKGIMNQLNLPAKKWALSIANNHSGDKGEAILNETYNILNNMGITPVGLYVKEGFPVTVINCDGLRVGIAAWTQWMNCDVFSNGFGVNRLQQILSKDWLDAKTKYQLDILIGLPHWEYEFQHYPRKETRSTAKTLIDNYGFNLLVGAHSHTLMPMEWFNNGLCQYSLGNFCGLGSAWPVKLIPILEVKVGVDNETKGQILGYTLYSFVQLPKKNRIDIVPLEEVPFALRNKIINRLKSIVTM
jgi:hypothetical protein